jgi:hypothetical protein
MIKDEKIVIPKTFMLIFVIAVVAGEIEIHNL